MKILITCLGRCTDTDALCSWDVLGSESTTSHGVSCAVDPAAPEPSWAVHRPLPGNRVRAITYSATPRVPAWGWRRGVVRAEQLLNLPPPASRRRLLPPPLRLRAQPPRPSARGRHRRRLPARDRTAPTGHRPSYPLGRSRSRGPAASSSSRRLSFSPQLADLIPQPRRHRHRYHGVFAPNHPLRPTVTALAERECREAARCRDGRACERRPRHGRLW